MNGWIDDLAFDIFIADGGVDERTTMTDEQLHEAVKNYLHDMAEDYDSRDLIVQAQKKMGGHDGTQG